MKKLVKVKSAKKGAARCGAVQLEPNKFLGTLYVVSGIILSLCWALQVVKSHIWRNKELMAYLFKLYRKQIDGILKTDRVNLSKYPQLSRNNVNTHFVCSKFSLIFVDYVKMNLHEDVMIFQLKECRCVSRIYNIQVANRKQYSIVASFRGKQWKIFIFTSCNVSRGWKTISSGRIFQDRGLKATNRLHIRCYSKVHLIIIIIIWFGDTFTVTHLTKCNTYSEVRAMSA